jgi:hypothetical protein
VEVLDFTAYFTFSVFFIPDSECETVQVNVKVFMDFTDPCHLPMKRFAALLGPRCPPGQAITTTSVRDFTTHSHSSARSIAAHFSQSAREMGHPELLWGRENRKWATRPNSPAGYTSCAG